MTVQLDVTADQLQPGDIVLDELGAERDHAVFDVAVDAEGVHIWTAAADQTFGWPPKYTVDPGTTYRVAR